MNKDDLVSAGGRVGRVYVAFGNIVLVKFLTNEGGYITEPFKQNQVKLHKVDERRIVPNPIIH